MAHADPRQEPHAFVLIAAVKNVDAIAGDRVMKCRALVLGNESEESFAAMGHRRNGTPLRQASLVLQR